MATINYIEEQKHLNSWVEKANADNAVATAIRAAEESVTHFITGIVAAFSGTATKVLQVKDGNTVIFEAPVVNGLAVDLVAPLKGTPGNAVSATLAASGTAGIVGYVNLIGFSV